MHFHEPEKSYLFLALDIIMDFAAPACLSVM